MDKRRCCSWAGVISASRGAAFPALLGVMVAREQGRNKGHAVVDKTDFVQVGMEMAAVEIRSDLLDLSAADRAMCWVSRRCSVGELSLEQPGNAWGKGGDQEPLDPIQPSGFAVLDISLKLPLVAWMLP